MTLIEATGWTVFTLFIILSGVLYLFYIIKPKQYAKNKAKQEAAERKYLDRILSSSEPEIVAHCFPGIEEKKLTSFN